MRRMFYIAYARVLIYPDPSDTRPTTEGRPRRRIFDAPPLPLTLAPACTAPTRHHRKESVSCEGDVVVNAKTNAHL